DSNVTTIFGLWGGTYSVTVIDANGCISGAIVTVSEPSALNSAIITSTPTSCNGICDGIATILTGGGIVPYSYLWTDGQITSTALGLCAGTHNIVVTDGNGCVDANQVTIVEPASLLITDSIIDVSCFGNTDGSIYTNVTGGTPFFSYTWSPSGGNNSSATNLSPQAYTVTVTDLNNCTATSTMTVNEPIDLTAITGSIPATCGNNNGTATVTISGGTGPYTYLWDDPLNTTNATVIDLLPRDPYYATVTDANGCTLIVPVTVMDQPGPIIDSISIDNVNCSGNADGEATVYFINGTFPFTYLWDDPAAQTTATATNLDVGPIGIMVTDSNGCEVPASAVITEPNPLILTMSPDVTICYGDSATIWASGSGGTLPYSAYTWTNLVTGNTQTVGPDSTTTYSVFILDINGCPSPVGSVTVNVNPLIAISAPDIIICEGDTAFLTAAASGGAGDTSAYIYSWSNGFVGSPQPITGLMDDDDTSFVVTVTDSCGAAVSDTVYVTVNPAPEITFDSDGFGCFPYVFVAYTSLPDSIPIVSWYWEFGDGTSSNDSGSTSHAYTDSGTYNVTLTVVSIQGCSESYTEQGAATVFELPTAEFIMTQNGSIIDPAVISELSPWVDFINTSSSNVDSVYWNFDDPASDSANTSSLFNPTHIFSDTGTYNVLLVVVTANGCIDSIRHEITVQGEFILFAPSAFTPNEDGDNDYFMPKGIGIQGETFELYIFDRWGDLIAKVLGEFSDDPMIGWNGRANDGEGTAQIDVYVWLIRTEDINGDAHEYVGHVTLLR
ncbi:MAG TPA: T9SS type B sorting domain-containing protein, partial [Flavobacteriales bacterium]|nr:T9SS type B sorting domain-containing protein [Flavobacteriales bacterium]